MTKFDWKASESAPKNYLMEIVDGSFLSQDDSSLYIPKGKSILQGWGWPVSNHVVGPDLKSLPDKLYITFLSYMENKFYRGEFDLPYNEILSLFTDGYFSPKEGKNITYNRIIAGVAPGGTVAVWLSGIDRRTEIFFGKAKEVEGDWKWIVDNPELSREQFIKQCIEEEVKPQEIKSIQKHGIPFDKWKIYHDSRYYWKPQFTGLKLRDNWIQLVKYYNGEEGYLSYPAENKEENDTLAVPQEIHFVWSYNKDKNYNYELYFDEDEIFSAYSKLGSKNEPLELEMKLYEQDNKTRFSVSLKSKNDRVPLKKFRLETYGAN